MENENKVSFKETSLIVKKSLKSSYSNHKKLWKFGIAVIIIIALLVSLTAVLRSQWFIYSAADIIIPKKITDQYNDSLVFYREKNPDFKDAKYDGEQSVELLYNYYYIDSKGEKKYISNGIYQTLDSSGEKVTVAVAVGFLYEGGRRLQVVITVIKWIAAVVFAAFIITLICVWYKKDKERLKSFYKSRKSSRKK
ncbi:MAG: hypothetical protein LUG21_04805 [Clostridiales bacterium]|nr:hypothetical protein [Clostridiales bacterium]